MTRRRPGAEPIEVLIGDPVGSQLRRSRINRRIVAAVRKPCCRRSNSIRRGTKCRAAPRAAPRVFGDRFVSQRRSIVSLAGDRLGNDRIEVLAVQLSPLLRRLLESTRPLGSTSNG